MNLIPFDKIQHQIATAKDIQELSQLADKMKAYQILAKQSHQSIELQNEIAEYKIKVDRKCGEWLDKNVEHKGGRLSTKTELKLPENITRKESSKLQKLASIPENEINKICNQIKNNQKVINNDVILNEVKKDNRQNEIKKMSKKTKRILPVNIQLLEGDFFDKIKEIKDSSIDLLITDPPYFMKKAEWDVFKNKNEFIEFTQKWINNILCKLKKDYQMFICFNSEYFVDLELICRQLELPIQSRLIWHYRNAGGKSQGKYMFSKTYDIIFHIGNKELNFDNNWSDERFDVWTIAIPQSNFKDGKYHITQKPIELFKRLIKLGSKENDLILDCFAGSGTTGLVCKELNRNCIMIEKEKEYINIIKNRI